VDRSALSLALEEIALLMSLKGENPFKVRAFENGARVISSLDDLEERLGSGRLGTVAGLGKGLVEVVTELQATGRSTLAESLRAEIPPSLPELLRVPGLGPKKATALWKSLGVTSLGELEYAITENRLVSLEGFGLKTQEKFSSGLAFVKSSSGQWRLPAATARADRALEILRSSGDEARVTRVEIAGDLRRSLETVSQVCLVVACEDPSRLPRIPDAAGAPPVSVLTSPPDSFGNLWLDSTGSAEHVDALRRRDPAVFALPSRTEEEIYARLGLSSVPPELREGAGPISRAAAGDLFRLIAPGDIRGLFHLHTTYSDGKATLAQTFQRLVELGYSFVGITDHSPAAAYAGGLPPERVKEQWREIDSLRPKFPSLTIFRGTEADILPDGSIDYGDEFLAGFDFVIASVHSAFHLPEKEQTARLLRAVANPRVTMLGHATGRLLLTRSGFPVDLDAVLLAAGAAGCGVELNASPHRLDLDWRFGEKARAAGVFTSINPDAHDLPALEHVRFGVGIARKAGFGTEHVLNTRGAGEVASELGRLRMRA
jgi:DNA polymerase (family X)